MAKKKSRRSIWGSVYLRTDRGDWAVRLPLDEEREPGSRPRYRIHGGFKSKKDAEDALKAFRAKHDLGELVVMSAADEAKAEAGEGEEETAAEDIFTLADALAEYIEVKEAAGAAETTLKGYRTFQRIVGQHDIAKVSAEKVTPEMLEGFAAWRREHVYWKGGREREGTTSAATTNRTLAFISAAMMRLVRLQRLPRNPVAQVARGKEKKQARVPLSKEEAARLIAAAEEGFRPLVVTALYTGARRGELLSLCWRDVDLDTGAVTLRRSKVGNWSRLRLHPAVVAELSALKKRRGLPNEREHIFLNRWGMPLKSTKAAWRKAKKDAGLEDRPGITFHSLRHTFACHFLEGGAAVTDLQGILGHANLSTTEIYAKMVDKRANEAILAMDYGTPPAGKLRTRVAHQTKGGRKRRRKGRRTQVRKGA